MKVTRLSALWLPLPPGNIPGTHFCKELSQPQCQSAAVTDYVNENFQQHHPETNWWTSASRTVPQLCHHIPQYHPLLVTPWTLFQTSHPTTDNDCRTLKVQGGRYCPTVSSVDPPNAHLFLITPYHKIQDHKFYTTLLMSKNISLPGLLMGKGNLTSYRT